MHIRLFLNYGGSSKMKKVISLVLVITMLLALGVTAFAAGSPTGTGKKETGITGAGGVYDENGKRASGVPSNAVIVRYLPQANTLEDADKEAFLKAYEDAKNIEGKRLVNVVWVDIADEYKSDVGFVRYYFVTPCRNIEVSVNGKDMDVVRLGNGQYYAKLTDFGPVVITSK